MELPSAGQFSGADLTQAPITGPTVPLASTQLDEFGSGNREFRLSQRRDLAISPPRSASIMHVRLSFRGLSQSAER